MVTGFETWAMLLIDGVSRPLAGVSRTAPLRPQRARAIRKGRLGL
jgi:hypothetical protein